MSCQSCTRSGASERPPPVLRRLMQSLWAVPLLLPGAILRANADSLPARPTTATAADPDWLLAVSARRALQQDPVLGSLNLGVTVYRRTATVWGIVPNREAARRTEKLLRQVRGVAGVHSELRVLPPGDPLRKILNPPGLPRPVPPLFDLPPRRPGALTVRIHDAAEVSPAWPQVITPAMVVPVAPTATPEPAAAPGSTGLENELARLQQEDVGFRAVRVEVHGGLVRLTAPPRQAADAMRLATVVSRLPGVQRVIVDGINGSP